MNTATARMPERWRPRARCLREPARGLPSASRSPVMTLGREAARGGHVAAMWRQCRNLFGRRAGDHGIVGVCELAIAQTLFKVGGFPTGRRPGIVAGRGI